MNLISKITCGLYILGLSFLPNQIVLAQISKPKRVFLESLLTSNSPNRNYSINEEAKIEMRAFVGGNPVNGYLYYSISEDIMPITRKDSVPFINGLATIDAGTMQKPGFKTIKVDFYADGSIHHDMIKLAFSPSHLRSYTPNPSDFDKFWNNSLEDISNKILKVDTTYVPKLSTDKVDVYLVKLNYGKNGECMYGYMSKPKRAGKYPVLFNPPGAGSKKIVPNNMYAERNVISITSEIHGLNPELSDEKYEEERKRVSNYVREGIEDKNKFYYRKVYVGCSRFVDYLCSLSDWDGKNVGVTGGSQGGALTIVTAALNKKVNYIAAFYPALCDLTGFLNGRAGGWPQYFRNSEDFDIQKFKNTIPYYDVVNFARRLTIPGFYSYGYNDETCSPTSVTAILNEISAPKLIDITPTSGHWRFATSNEASIKWMEERYK